LLIVLRSGSTGHSQCSKQADHVLKIVFQRCSLWFLSEHFARGGSHKIICCQAGNFCVWSLGCSRSRSYSCMHDWGDQFTIWYCDPCIDLGSWLNEVAKAWLAAACVPKRQCAVSLFRGKYKLSWPTKSLKPVPEIARENKRKARRGLGSRGLYYKQ
jgi:hypothetical protein